MNGTSTLLLQLNASLALWSFATRRGIRLINGLASYPLKSGTSHGVHFEAGLSKSLEDYTHPSHSVGVEPPANVSIFKGIKV